jgi:hypothetical protein
MNIAGNRYVKLALDIAIALAVLAFLHVFFIGDIAVRIGKLTFTCHGLQRPLVLLLLFLTLRPILARPSPCHRFSAWLTSNRRTIARALLILAFAAIPRFWNLGGNNLNPDELLWIDRGQKLIRHVRERRFKKATARLGHPGIVPAALIGISYTYLATGPSPVSFKLFSPVAAARLPIAFVGAMTCLLLYLLGRSAFGDDASFWASALLAFYPSHIALSRVTHIDSTLAFFFASSLLSYLMYARRSRLRWNVASAVFFGLALLTKTPAYVIPLILFVWKGSVYLHDRRRNARFWNAGDLLWLGIGIGIYFALYTKLWSDPLETNWLKFARFLPPAAMLARFINSVSSFPWLQLTAAACAISILCIAARRGSGAPAGKNVVPPLLLGVFTVLLCLTFVQIFRRPLINELLHMSKVYYTGEIGHLKYWMGEKVSTPPYWFYPFMLFIQTPPLMLLFLVCGFVRGCGAVKKRERGWEACLLGLLAPLVLIAIMSAGRKMAYRYIDPAIPFICLIAAIGFTGVVQALASLPSIERFSGARLAVRAVAASCLAISMVVPLVRVAPAYDIYCNLFIGGPAGASRVISIGPEVGKREAVEYLKAHARDEDSIVTGGSLAEFRYYWEHEQPRPEQRVLFDRTTIEYADWLVLPLSHRVRRLPNADLTRARNPLKVYSVMKCGVDFLDVYKLDDTPVTENRSYAAADLKTPLGTIVPDGDAESGSAVKAEAGEPKGAFVRGPNARYSRGCWRAVFRLKAGDVAGDAPLCRLSVAGLSAEEVIRAVDLRADEFGAGGYREFPVDFCIDRNRRLQFCVESSGTAPLWVDRVTVLKR